MNAKIKLLIYELLTFLIIVLGKWRKMNVWYDKGHSGKCEARKRNNASYNASYVDECCDCGLEHINSIVSLKRVDWVARRPKGYKYKLR